MSLRSAAMRAPMSIAVACLMMLTVRSAMAACGSGGVSECRALDSVQRLVCRPGRTPMVAVLDNHRHLPLPADLVRCGTIARRACAFVLPAWQPVCDCSGPNCCPLEPESIFAIVRRGRRGTMADLPGVQLRCRGG